MKEKMKRLKNWLPKLFIVFLCICVVIGTISFSLFKKDDKLKIIYIPKTKDETFFWSEVVAGAESAAKEYQVELEVLAPDEEKNIEQQKAYIKQAIKKEPDALVVSPSLYTGMTEIIEEATELGIPLILVDSQLDKDIESSYIGTDNADAGVKMGEKVQECIKEDTKIAVMSQAKETSTAIEREEGLRKGLGKEERRIEKVLYCESDRQIACNLTKELLSECSDIDCIVGLNLVAVTGVAQAVEEMGLSEQVHVIGMDSDDEGIAYMERGTIDALVVQKPFHMGYFGIKTAVEIAEKQKVEPIIYSETELITIDNIYSPQNEKLLFTF